MLHVEALDETLQSSLGKIARLLAVGRLKVGAEPRKQTIALIIREEQEETVRCQLTRVEGRIETLKVSLTREGASSS